jgi:hypothetical protein
MAKQKTNEPHEPRKERWAFSQSELAQPVKCNGYDELVAYVHVDDDWDSVESFGIIVYRNGEVSNRFDDGTAGVPKELVELADCEESLLHPDGEETAKWRDVMADGDGNFLDFAK